MIQMLIILGAVLYKLGQYEGYKILSKSNRKDPNFSVSYFNLGLLNMP